MVNYQVVHKNESFLLFGGSLWSVDFRSETTIAAFNVPSKIWSRIGSLNVGRWSHGVIDRGNDFIIVGGCSGRHGKVHKGCFVPMISERCEMQDDQMICVTVEPKLTSYSRHAETMLVEDGFCVIN